MARITCVDITMAHLAEAHNVTVCQHFLMELHVSLVCAIPNARWLDYIPQLDLITNEGMAMDNGRATPSNLPGLGRDWNWQAISKATLISDTTTEGSQGQENPEVWKLTAISATFPASSVPTIRSKPCAPRANPTGMSNRAGWPSDGHDHRCNHA